MEVGVADAPGRSSHCSRRATTPPRQRNCALGFAAALALALAACCFCSARLLSQELGHSAVGAASRSAGRDRRLLATAGAAQEGDYETVPLIEKAAEDERKGGQRDPAVRRKGAVGKDAESKALLDKVANGDEDYENVALTGGLRKDSERKERSGTEEGGGEKGDGRREETGAAAADEEAEHTGVEKLLDRLEESVGKEDGRFNKTIEQQEGVLETVARVGGRGFDEGEGEEGEGEQEEAADAGKLAVKETGKEGSGTRTGEDSKVGEEEEEGEAVGHAGNAGDGSAETGDVTWLERIMGQSDQAHPLVKDPLAKDSLRNHSLAQGQRRNATREDNPRYHQVEDVPRLIDREDNEYVISNPGKNRMMLQEDMTLISDIVVVIVAAALGGTVCGLLGQPVILGYLVAGMVVGPGGLHLVHEIVQVETLAQFGVVFLLFVLGVEFNPSKMQGIHNVTLGGGCIQIGTAMLLGGLLSPSVSQGVFTGAFLSMSSTAVVVKCLVDSKMGGTKHGQIMLGTLILQDCALGLLLAIMPALAAKGSDAGTFALALSRAAVLLAVYCGCAWVLAKMFIPHFLRALVQLTKFNSELFLLGALGVCLSFALISQSLGLSLEVGAFVGGLVLSGGAHTAKTLHQAEPIRNVFAALFLASIGMVMHPAFLWEHKHILMASLAVVFVGKTCLFAGVVRAFGYSKTISISVGVALAQIGEFAFILLSRAQGLGLISKKLYLLLMGTSALSLVLTPFAFKIVIRWNPPGTFSTGNNVVAPATNSMPSAELPVSDQHVEPIDMEDGRGDPSTVTLRRPLNATGKWNAWRNELKATEVFDQR